MPPGRWRPLLLRLARSPGHPDPAVRRDADAPRRAGRAGRPLSGAAYDATQWHDLFVACAGAAAALTGLLFVAVSIHLRAILAYRGLPARALETLALLMGVLLVSVFGLVPGQGRTALGVPAHGSLPG